MSLIPGSGRAELSVADGFLPSADLPRGVFHATSLAGGGIRIDHADPRVLISAELLAKLYVTPSPDVYLQWDELGCARAFWSGALLKFFGVNRTVVYRIGEYVPRARGYIGEWPD